MVFLFLFPCMINGCGQAKLDPLVKLPESSYAQVERMTTTVKRGDLTPVYEDTILLSGYEETSYRVGDELFRNLDGGYEVKVDSVNVQMGDTVKEGDVMLSFSSKKLEEQRLENEKTKRHAVLSIEHFEKMKDINPFLDFTLDIADLRDDMSLAQTYIDEVDKVYGQLNVIAQKDGIVSFVDPSVTDGFLAFGKPMFIVASDDGYYTAQPWKGREGSDELRGISFAVGERFAAKSRLAEYEVEVIPDPHLGTGVKADTKDNGNDSDAGQDTGTDDGTNTGSEGSPDTEDNKKQSDADNDPDAAVSENSDASSQQISDTDTSAYTPGDENEVVYFKLIGGGGTNESELTIYKNMEQVKDVCYVESSALIQHEEGGDIFAYKQTQDGTFVAVKVDVGNVVGEYAVIEDGLTEGDVVSVPANVDYRDEIKPNSNKSKEKQSAWEMDLPDAKFFSTGRMQVRIIPGNLEQ